MEFYFLWWHWVALGLGLLSIDLVLTNIIYLFWIGLGAVATGMVARFIFMPFWLQCLLFGTFSIVFLLFWLFLLKPRFMNNNIDEAYEGLPGQAGVVVRYNSKTGRGTVRLQRPFAGKDVWEFQSAQELRSGQRVVITELGSDGIVLIDEVN